uniref:DUF4371 domain-containing protein n=1 Tax=Amphimedon queenslandica TaxID=400682 RepID=A0A1X7VI38_AMPQE
MAFCKLCNCNLEATLSDLRKHVSTKKHSDNAKLISQHRPLDSLPNATFESQVSLAEALWGSFTAEHNLAFALSDHATKLFVRMFPDSEIAKFSSGRTKTTAVITNVLAPYTQQKLINSMNVMKSACMVIRIFDEDAGIVRSEFYKLAELGDKADAETLFNAIESTFREDGIPFDNLIGFASDGANTMLELDVANEDHHLSNDQLFVGVATRRFIDSCDEIDVHQLTPFFSNCRNYFIAAIQEIRKRCPLDDPQLKLLSFLDPHQCKQVEALQAQTGPPDPAVVGQAQHLKMKLESLDAEFKIHHYAVVDTITDKGEQAKEHSELDLHDDAVIDLRLRLQALVTTHSTSNQES